MILHAPATVVKFDSAASPRSDRPFGLGILKALRGPTALDLAWKAGFDVAMECEGPVEDPAHYSPAERSAFLAGLMEGASVVHARELAQLADLAMQAEADEVLSAGVPCW